MSHEEIVATVLYFERDEYIRGGNILFKRVFQRDEANDILYGAVEGRPEEFDDFVKQGILPLGQVDGTISPDESDIIWAFVSRASVTFLGKASGLCTRTSFVLRS